MPTMLKIGTKRKMMSLTMPTITRTRKTSTKYIRFPHLLIEHIHQSLDAENSANFSAWVLDACSRKLKAEQRTKAKTTNETNL
ncbi:YlcI/YnfO family protein [Klebsiella oxytoca]|uniref:YlcI/YnfO family protein n=1 Tax=Klebsiella oxytoca TaxID=571 RepID=UPI0039C95F64